jgi:hypothetical protein
MAWPFWVRNFPAKSKAKSGSHIPAAIVQVPTEFLARGVKADCLSCLLGGRCHEGFESTAPATSFLE